MASPEGVLALLERMRCVADDQGRAELVGELSALDGPKVLSFLNVHAINVCWEVPAALGAFAASDILLRDGVGLERALPLLGQNPGLNMNGTDFIPFLLATLPARRIAVYGTRRPWLDRAAHRLETTTAHRVIDRQHGFHPLHHYLERARATRPELILLAMGMPRQEETAALLRQTLNHPVLIINGGAIADFIAGRFERAPVALQNLGLEWLFRLAREPRRLFSRYVLGGVGFAHRLARMRRARARLASKPA